MRVGSSSDMISLDTRGAAAAANTASVRRNGRELRTVEIGGLRVPYHLTVLTRPDPYLDIEAYDPETGEGVEALLARLDALLTAGARVHEIVLPAGEGQKIAWLHAHGQVLDDHAEEGGAGPVHRLTVRLTPKEFGRFESLEG